MQQQHYGDSSSLVLAKLKMKTANKNHKKRERQREIHTNLKPNTHSQQQPYSTTYVLVYKK